MTVRAALWGTGRAGGELVRWGLERPWLQYVAAIVTSPAKAGRDLGEIAGVGRTLGVTATLDVDATLARDDIDVVLYAGLGDEHELGRRMLRVVRAGKNALTVSGMVHPRTALGEAGARDLHEAAVANGVRAIGTGINPGFMVDVLPVVWMSGVATYTRLTARRISDMKAWGPGVLRDEGVGLRPEALGQRETHMTLDQSLNLIADAAGLTFDAVRLDRTPIVSPTRRENAGTVVEPGTVCGFRSRIAGIIGGQERIVIEWTAVFMLDPVVDGMQVEGVVEFEGAEWLRMQMQAALFDDPYPATAARALAVLPGLLSMPPGLYDGAQIPFAVRRR